MRSRCAAFASAIVAMTLFVSTSRADDSAANRQPKHAAAKAPISAVPPTGAIVTGAIGLVGIGLGIGFGVASGDANSTNLARGTTAGGVCSTNPTASVCMDGKSTRDAQQTDAILSTVGYVVGGVALATAVVWWLVAPRRVVEHQAMILPTFGPHTAGAAFNFTF